MSIRTEDSTFTSWILEVDRRLLWAVLALVLVGAIFVVSAGSVSAERINQPWYYFLVKSIPFYVIGLITLFVASMLKKKWVLGISALNVCVGLALLAWTCVAPYKIKGSARFVHTPITNISPSDIMKPGFVILTAWFLYKMHSAYGDNMFLSRDAWRFRKLSWWTYLAIFVPVLLIMFLHPDGGTAFFYTITFGGMTFVAGLPWLIVIGLVGFGLVAGLAAFMIMPHVHARFMSFFTGQGDRYQVTQSIQSIQHGGLLGSGDDAFVKESLPDAHTDFIYAAIVEDFGAIVACVLLCALVYVLKRLTTDAMTSRNPFVFYATGGAAILFGTQVCINLATTLHLMPPKGMTLPFISYGGSSFIGFCLLFGMILALVREDKWK